jgi:hypothetical protein
MPQQIPEAKQVLKSPSWIADGKPVAPEYLAAAKEALHILAACEYARRLHNAVWKWHRRAALDAGEEQLLAGAFPRRWPGSPLSEAEVKKYLKDVWEPRQNAVQAARAEMRQRPEVINLDWVDWDGLI